MEVATVEAARLDLVSMSPEFLRASLDGQRDEAARLIGATLPDDWPPDSERWLQRRLDQMADAPHEQPWLLRAMVLRDEPERPLVGYINFHDPPAADGSVEIGYTVLAPYRRRGFAREAAEAMFAWAQRQQPIRCFRASVSPTNAPSLALAASLGFVQVGRQWDEEDGEELVFELRTQVSFLGFARNDRLTG